MYLSPVIPGLDPRLPTDPTWITFDITDYRQTNFGLSDSSVVSTINHWFLPELGLAIGFCTLALTGRALITLILKSLHWLPINLRINFKILLLVFKSLHGNAPLIYQKCFLGMSLAEPLGPTLVSNLFQSPELKSTERSLLPIGKNGHLLPNNLEQPFRRPSGLVLWTFLKEILRHTFFTMTFT